jgi:hypothetical protein
LFRNFTITNIFFYEYGQENVYNEQGIKVLDPMEDVLTQITDPNIVLETITLQNSYLETRKSIEEKIVKESNDIKLKAVTYNKYSNKIRWVFIDRMLESAEEKGRIVKFAKELGIEPRAARRWWERYQKHIKCHINFQKRMPSCTSSFTYKHEAYIRNLLDEDPQLYIEDII